jgi:thiamine-phosphate pyrophosphorylase
MKNRLSRGYYFITDLDLSLSGNVSDVRNAVRASVTAIQYRCKAPDSRGMYDEACELKKLCAGIPFLINDRVDICLAADADGVHLGQNDLPCSAARALLGPDKIIGISVSSLAQALMAIREGADYLGIGPIYSTATKADAGEPVGLELLKAVRKITDLPIVAIGGINLSNAKPVITAGADAICAISAVVTQADVFMAIGEFQTLWKK